MKQYDTLVDGHIKRCEIRGITETTAYGRRREIERFGLWFKRKKPRPKVNCSVPLCYRTVSQVS